MRKSDFHYALPPELIAQTPLEPRSSSRLLVLDRSSGAVSDRVFADLPALLHPGDLLVFNDTRVIPARLLGSKETGGAVELLVERVLDDRRVLAQLRASKTPRPGQRLILAEGAIQARVIERRQDLFEIAFEGEQTALDLLERFGRVPLPPYIERDPDARDRERYQTVYAREPGAVAAPTAGLHFDPAVLEALSARGVHTAFVTLHVGAGTFQPLRVEDVREHRMHPEYVSVDAQACAAIDAARRAGRRVVAVGTTVVRALESAAAAGPDRGMLRPFSGETRIFIYPSYRFRVVDALVTNFHLPESTLLMLVCAFAGMDPVLQAYRHAVAERYRFFSYGDAMFIG